MKYGHSAEDLESGDLHFLNAYQVFSSICLYQNSRHATKLVRVECAVLCGVVGV